MTGAEDLFSGSKKQPQKKKAAGPLRAGLIDSLEHAPIVYGIQNNLFRHNFNLISSGPQGVANNMKDGITDLAIIASVDYAKKKENWKIIPQIGVASSGETRGVQLFFRTGLQKIRKIAVDEDAGSALGLLQILMQERFMITPDYIPADGNIEQMLGQADAALLAPEKALDNYIQNRNHLDLVEEWADLTGLPFVHSFCVVRELTAGREEVRQVQKSFALGMRNLEQICKHYAADHTEDWSFYHDYLTRDLTYRFSEREQDGLMEFYNYAFYFGLTDYIPDLNFY